MASTTFTDGQTPILASWLNDVNNAVYDGTLPPGVTVPSSSISYTPAGTSAVETTVQNKLQETISVVDFGADKTGVADSTSAIQAAIDYAQSNTKVHCIEFPTGNYKVSSTISIHGSFGYGLYFKGNRSVITSTYNGVVFDCNAAIPTPAPAYRQNVNFSDLVIIGPGKASTSSVGIKLYGANYSLNHVQITNFYTALYGPGCLISEFVECIFDESHFGVWFEQAGSFSPNDVHFYKCNIITNDRAVKFTDFDYGAITFVGCEIEGNNLSGTTTDGVAVCEFSGSPSGAGEVTFIGTHFEQNPGQYNIYYNSPAGRHLNIIGCKIIPGDSSGNCVYIDYGELYVTGSHITQNVGQNIYLTANTTSAFIVGDTAGYVNGTATNLVRVRQGTINVGGAATGATDAGIASKGGLGIGAVVEGNIQYNNSSGTRLGYLNSSGIALDASAQWSISTGHGSFLYTRLAGYGIEPGSDNNMTLGSGALRWSTVYAGTGTINTSDEREKTEFKDLSEAERQAALVIKGLIKSFKFKDAVAKKGDKARIHFGVAAQQVAEAFRNVGLNPDEYAMFCYDEWEATEAVVDENGNEMTPAQSAGNRYGIRYDELLAFVISVL